MAPVYGAPNPKHVQVTVQFSNSPLPDALRELSARSGIRIVLDSRAQGSVTGKFEKIPIEQVLETILAPHGLRFLWMGDFYLVGSKSTLGIQAGGKAEQVLRQEPTEAVQLQHLPAAKAVALVQQNFPGVSARPDAQLRAVVLQGPQELLGPAKALLTSLDKPPLDRRTTEVVKLRYVKAHEAAGTLAQLFPGVSIKITAETNSLVLTASAPVLQQMRQVLSGMDTQPATPLSEPRSETFQLKSARVAQVLPVLRRLFPSARLLESPTLNAIVATDHPAVLEKIKTVVTELDHASPLDPVVEAIILQHAPASDVALTLERGFPDVRVQVNLTNNSLVLTGLPAELARVKALLLQMDRPVNLPASLQSTEVIRLKEADPVQVASILSAQLGTAARISVDGRLRALVVTAGPQQMNDVRELVAKLDAQVPQVVLESYMLEVNVNELENLGLSVAGPSTLVFTEEAKREKPEEGVHIPIGARPEEMPGYLLPQMISRSRLVVTAVLNLLIQEGTGRILATPKVATMDGKPAKILTRDKFPVVLTTTSQTNPPVTTQTIQTFEAGISLAVTPRITANGYITMDLNPQVSTITGFSRDGVPYISTREAQSSIRIRDGESLVMGGLIREQDLESISKVPILGEVPILGYLFQSRRTDKVRSELVIIVTPYIL